MDGGEPADQIRRTASGAPLPPPIHLNNERAAGQQTTMQNSHLPSSSQSMMAAASASPSRSASAALNGYSSDDCGGGSRSARSRMRAVRAGRSQPFFIGVAGKTRCFGKRKGAGIGRSMLDLSPLSLFFPSFSTSS